MIKHRQSLTEPCCNY